MNIYKVERIDRVEYDDYSAFICVAESEEDARMLMPYCIGLEGREGYGFMDKIMILDVSETGTVKGYHEDGHTDNTDIVDGWVSNIKDLKVTKLGWAGTKYTKHKIILSSYHAG